MYFTCCSKAKSIECNGGLIGVVTYSLYFCRVVDLILVWDKHFFLCILRGHMVCACDIYVYSLYFQY